MIRVLDKFIAEKIAAGEVIERPVSVIKELVENSIDAGASSIIVEIRSGGKSYIRVTDDGSGIPRDEVELAFQRHATSKISSIQDLDNITSLGFRGEALASISAISRLTIVTRTHDSNAGIKLVMHGGQIISNEPTGANKGTTIIVENIFYNVPARRKFMSSDARETTSIIELIQSFAICYSNIRFMMVRDGVTIFTTTGNGDILAAIRKIFPGDEYSKLIKLDSDGVKGYISGPGVVKSNRKSQHFYVNKRLVSSPIIEKAIEKGYGGRIFSGHPIAFLLIEASPDEIDINIHPTKKEIKFLRPDEITEKIVFAIANALSSDMSIPAMNLHSRMMETYHDNIKADIPKVTEQSSIREYLNALDRDPVKQDDVQVDIDQQASISDRPFDFEDLRFAAYIFNSYIIMQSKEALYIFDQHAAHERINYEKYIAAYNSANRLTQQILTPLVLSFNRSAYEASRNMLEPLTRMGYDISDFGEGSFIVRAIPSYVTITEAESFLKAFIEASSDEVCHDSTIVSKLIMRSCKASVKARSQLSQIEIDTLIQDLAKCENPYACPHGRPTFIKITQYEIERSFKRK